MSATVYPVRVQARLDPRLSRWLWIVKWVLAIPHYVVLAFLWVAFVVTTVVAGFAILFTGRYPRSIFDFNVGVLRWTWRVEYYSYGALATDQYPPFSLEDVPDYPARLEVAYPERLSRGLVLVKWWLLALPHYLIVGLFAGGGVWAAFRFGDAGSGWLGGGLIGLLVLVAAIILAVTGRYPTGLYDFILGLNRWVLRVAGYAGLMTDQYPPFRLDTGGDDPAGAVAFIPSDAAVPTVAPPHGPTPAPLLAGEPAGKRGRPGMGAGRIVVVVLGALLTLVGLGATAAGSVLAWANSSRDSAGYLTTSSERFSTPTAAVASDGFTISIEGNSWLADHLGNVRITATSAAGKPVFVGIGPESDVKGWLAGTAHDQIRNLETGPFSVDYARQPGTLTKASPPTAQTFWAARGTGTATQTLTWPITSGRWTIVVANADGTPGVAVDARLGAKLPWLGGLSAGLIAGGLVLLAGGIVAILVAVMRRRRRAVTP